MLLNSRQACPRGGKKSPEFFRVHFSHPLEPAHSWFNFLTDGYLVVCEQLAAAAPSGFMPWAFLALPKLPRPQVEQGCKRRAWLLPGLQHPHPPCCFWDPPWSSWARFPSAVKKKKLWMKEKLPLSHPLAVTAFVFFFSCLVPDEPPSSVLVTPHTTSSVLVQWQVGKWQILMFLWTIFWLLWLVEFKGTLPGTFFWAASIVLTLKDYSYFLICLI